MLDTVNVRVREKNDELDNVMLDLDVGCSDENEATLIRPQKALWNKESHRNGLQAIYAPILYDYLPLYGKRCGREMRDIDDKEEHTPKQVSPRHIIARGTL